MLRFEHEHWCLPVWAAAETHGGARQFGLENTLTVVFVEAGGGSLLPLGAGAEAAGEQSAPPLPAPKTLAGRGCVLLANGPVTLYPAPGGEDTLSTIGLGLAGLAAAELAAQLSGPVVLAPGAAPGAAEIIQRLAEGFEFQSAGEQSALAYTLVCRVAEAEGGEGYPALVSAAIEEIRQHYGEVYGVEELAAHLGVSKSHLIRSFTAAAGVSPGRYLTFVRLEAAKRLLVSGGHSLDVVATLCGFSGANYLCKVFKKETGETPAGFRRRALPTAAPEADGREQEMYL